MTGTIPWSQDSVAFDKFFIQSIYRKRNRIEMLQDDQGNWVDDQDELRALACKFFKDLYFAEPPPPQKILLSGRFPSISLNSLACLSSLPDPGEVRQALSDMKPLESAKVRFQAGFFQSQWHLVGKNVCEEVNRGTHGRSLG